MRVRSAKLGLIAGLLALAPMGNVLAATAPPSSGGSPGQGLEISPPLEELSANPGQSVTFNISIRDVTRNVLIAKSEADDFGASKNETGVPQLLLDETGETRYSLKYWIAPTPSINLQPLQLKAVPITINVPANAEPGGHYGVVRFTAIAPNLQGTGVALSASVGTLVLLTVNGPISHSMNVVQFASGYNNPSKVTFAEHSFFDTGPIDFLVRLRNTGSVHELPGGNIVVTNMFGGTVADLSVNANQGNVLPDSVRRFVSTLSDKKLFGYYRAQMNATYDGGKKLTASLSFWVIPWKLLLLILVALVIAIYLLRLGMKKYNEHIISQSRRR